MTQRITFTVDGLPKGQPRPRACTRRIGNRIVARVHEAGTAEGWKGLIAVVATPLRPSSPLLCPVEVSIRFRLPRPKSLCRRKDPDGELLALCKPDLDNAAKAVLDCLTQIGWWRDDAQVVRLIVEKVYHAKDGRPGADISIREACSDVQTGVGNGSGHGQEGAREESPRDHGGDGVSVEVGADRPARDWFAGWPT
jgi:Holliday junction resolvase RusA-like endonuclease